MWHYYHKVWLTLSLGWMSLYMVRVGMSPLLIPIMDEFELTYADAGLLSSAVFWAYTGMQIPSGNMGDRWGHRKFLLLGTFCWSVLSLLTGFVSGFIMLFLVRLLTGMAEGTYFGNDRPIISAFTPPEKMARGQGISTIGMGLGMGFGILLAGQIAEWWGWRMVFILYSIPSFVACFFVWRIIRDPEPLTREQEPLERPFSMVFKSSYLWMLYITGFAIMYVFWVLGTWAPVLFLELGVGSIGSSGMYAALLGFTAVPALLISGTISDKMKRKRQDRHFHLVVCLIAISVLTFLLGIGLDLELSSGCFVVGIILGGFAVWSFFPPFYAILADYVPKRVLGTAFGAANTVGFMASLVAPWCTGYLRDHTKSFSLGFYVTGLVLLMGLVSTVIALKLGRDPTGSQSPVQSSL